MQRDLLPQSASSGTWSNPSYALAFDADRAILAPGATNNYLRVFNFANRSLEGLVEIVGIGVTIETGLSSGVLEPLEPVDDGQFLRYEVSLSLDSTTAVGSPRYADANGGRLVFGGPTTTWGRTWTAAEIASADLSVLIRRGDVLGGEATGIARRVNAVAVTVYFNYEGGSIQMSGHRNVNTQRYNIGFAPSSNLGQAVAPSIMMKHSALALTCTPEYQIIETHGELTPSGQVETYAESTGPLEVKSADYNELAIWMILKHGVPASWEQLATGVWALEWVIDTRVNDRLAKMAAHCQHGDFNIAESFTYSVLRQFGITCNKKSVTVSGNGIAQRQTDIRNGGDTDSAGLQGGVNCRQTIPGPTGGPTGGAMVYKWMGQSFSVAYNANAVAVQSALEALEGVGAGQVTVTKPVSDWVIEFTGTQGGREQDLIVLASHNLTGGASPTPGVPAMTVKGGWTEFPEAPMVGGKAELFLANSKAGLAAAKLMDLREFAYEIGDSIDTDSNFDNTALTFTSLVDKPYTASLKMTVMDNNKAQMLRRDATSQVQKYVQIKWTADRLVAAGYPYSLQIDANGNLVNLGQAGAFGQTKVAQIGFNFAYDPTQGNTYKIRIVCAVPPTIIPA